MSTDRRMMLLPLICIDPREALDFLESELDRDIHNKHGWDDDSLKHVSTLWWISFPISEAAIAIKESLGDTNEYT